MSDLRKAAQAVIQAWDDPTGTTGVCRALDVLRAALAEPEQKPVAWLYTDAKGRPAMAFTKKAPYEDAVPLYTGFAGSKDEQ